MTRLTSLALFVVFNVGCNFDYQRQYSIMFPATLILRNDTQVELTISKMINSLGAKNAFVFPVGKISSGEKYSFQVSQEIYEDVRTGNFILLGICASKEEWEVAGTRLNRKAIYNDKEWSVTVSISNCGQ